MPIYEYACPSCRHEFEQIVKVSASAPPCPSCGSDEVDKKISLAAFHLKGGGWYSDAYAGSDNKKPGTDAKTEAKSTSESSDKGGSSSSESSTSSSTDSTSSSTPAKSSTSSASSTD